MLNGSGAPSSTGANDQMLVLDRDTRQLKAQDTILRGPVGFGCSTVLPKMLGPGLDREALDDRARTGDSPDRVLMRQPSDC